MKQLSLKLAVDPTYKPTEFVPHQGVALIIERVVSDLTCSSFALHWIEGAARSGRSHLAIHINSKATATRGSTVYMSGALLESRISAVSERIRTLGIGAVVIDDLDIYLNSVQVGESGPFVELVELCRVHRVALIVTSKSPIQALPCDDHVKSRLRAAQESFIGAPRDDELNPILAVMAKQRGIRLSDRNVSFLTQRVGRCVGDLERYLIRAIHLGDLMGGKFKRQLLARAM